MLPAYSINGGPPPLQPERWRRVDACKMALACVLPLLLMVTLWVPIRSPAPSRDQLRDALKRLDDVAFAQSGCSQVSDALARCDKASTGCDAHFRAELRNLQRNCHAISTKELEQCLMSSAGGRCIFERLEAYCNDDIAEVLACHKAAMQLILAQVLSPLMAGGGASESRSGGSGSSSAGSGDLGRIPAELWTEAAQAAAAVVARTRDFSTLSVLGWALAEPLQRVPLGKVAAPGSASRGGSSGALPRGEPAEEDVHVQRGVHDSGASAGGREARGRASSKTA